MSLRTLFFVSLTLTIGFSWLTMETQAQIFDRNSFGTSLRQERASSTGSEQDSIFSQNFESILEKRQNSSFVGSGTSEGGFVGSQQPGETASNVPSATQGIQGNDDNSARINRQLRALRQNEMYRPRLTVGFEVPESDVTERSLNLQERLLSSPAFESAESIVLTVKGRTVHLAGSVRTSRERDLASRILMFEPGVDAVHNELSVTPPIPHISH